MYKSLGGQTKDMDSQFRTIAGRKSTILKARRHGVKYIPVAGSSAGGEQPLYLASAHEAAEPPPPICAWEGFSLFSNTRRNDLDSLFGE